jgi:predicted transcriptional regulator
MSAPFTVRLDPEILDALDRLADRTERSRSWLIAKALEDYVALNAWQLEKVETGLKEAEAGEFASEDDVARVRAKFQTPG